MLALHISILNTFKFKSNLGPVETLSKMEPNIYLLLSFTLFGPYIREGLIFCSISQISESVLNDNFTFPVRGKVIVHFSNRSYRVCKIYTTHILQSVTHTDLLCYKYLSNLIDSSPLNPILLCRFHKKQSTEFLDCRLSNIFLASPTIS